MYVALDDDEELQEEGIVFVAGAHRAAMVEKEDWKSELLQKSPASEAEKAFCRKNVAPWNSHGLCELFEEICEPMNFEADRGTGHDDVELPEVRDVVI